MGFLSFLGVVLACPSCFLGLLGFSAFLVRSAPACWGGWRVAGGSGVRGRRARVVRSSSFCWGAGLGCACARLSVLLPRCRGAGSGCACCPVPVVGVGLCPVSSAACCGGGFRVLFFRPVLSVFFWFPVLVFVVLPGVGGLWGVSGWVGVVFSPASVVLARACFRFPSWGAGLGLGWVLFGEFDPGSGRTLAACLTHASRTGPLSFLGVG